jgi:hypothetical protein
MSNNRAARKGETAAGTREEARAKGIKWLVNSNCSGSPPRMPRLFADR